MKLSAISVLVFRPQTNLLYTVSVNILLVEEFLQMYISSVKIPEEPSCLTAANICKIS